MQRKPTSRLFRFQAVTSVTSLSSAFDRSFYENSEFFSSSLCFALNKLKRIRSYIDRVFRKYLQSHSIDHSLKK